MTAPELRGQDAITVAAAVRAVAEGHVLHVRAPEPRGVDLTAGPHPVAGALVVGYAVIRSGEEERHATPEEAIAAVGRRLDWHLDALRAALVKLHGPPEQAPSRHVEEARIAERGAALTRAFGHKADIQGAMGGPSFMVFVEADLVARRGRGLPR